MSLDPSLQADSVGRRSRHAHAIPNPERDFRVETFVTGTGIREIARLRRIYGRGRWRKRKGFARIRLPDGSVHDTELHWYEASGIGRKESKIKRLL